MSQQAPTPEQVYQQYQSVVEQLKILEGQLDNLTSVINELDVSIATINGIKDNKADEEIIIPIGGMIMIKANLTGIKEILVNVGSGVVVPLEITQAVTQVTDRKTEMIEYRNRLLSDQKKLSEIAQNLANHLNQLSGKK